MMPPPRVGPWFSALEVGLGVDLAAEVHVSTVNDFTPSAATHRMTLFGPGTVHVLGLAPGIDYYVRLVSIDGTEMSDVSLPVQTVDL